MTALWLHISKFVRGDYKVNVNDSFWPLVQVDLLDFWDSLLEIHSNPVIYSGVHFLSLIYIFYIYNIFYISLLPLHLLTVEQCLVLIV